MLYYAEEGTLTPEEMKQLVKDTYEVAVPGYSQCALDNRYGNEESSFGRREGFEREGR